MAIPQPIPFVITTKAAGWGIYRLAGEKRFCKPCQCRLVVSAHHFPAGVHGKDSGTDINGPHGKVGGDNGTDGSSALSVGVFGKALVRNFFFLAQGNHGT